MAQQLQSTIVRQKYISEKIFSTAIPHWFVELLLVPYMDRLTIFGSDNNVVCTWYTHILRHAPLQFCYWYPREWQSGRHRMFYLLIFYIVAKVGSRTRELLEQNFCHSMFGHTQRLLPKTKLKHIMSEISFLFIARLGTSISLSLFRYRIAFRSSIPTMLLTVQR